MSKKITDSFPVQQKPFMAYKLAFTILFRTVQEQSHQACGLFFIKN